MFKINNAGASSAYTNSGADDVSSTSENPPKHQLPSLPHSDHLGGREANNRPAAATSASTAEPLSMAQIHRASMAWLNAYSASASKADSDLARAVISGIQEGTLQVGNPAAQSKERAQYGKHVALPGGGSASLVINLAIRSDGLLELFSAAMRDTFTKKRTAISAQATAIPINVGGATTAPTLVIPSVQIPTQTQTQKTLHTDSIAARPELSRQITKHIDEIANSLTFSSERDTAQNQIVAKLSALPSDQHVRLILVLKTQLSNCNASAKARTIGIWAEDATVERIAERSDMRTPRERELQDVIDTLKNNPAFNSPLQEIFSMFSNYVQRKRSSTTNIMKGAVHASPLFSRVMADTRGPLVAIQDIRDHLLTVNDAHRYQALLDWKAR